MNPFLLIALAAGSWWLFTEYQRRKAAGTLPWDSGPRQLGPLSTEIPQSEEGLRNLEAWAQIDWGADLFPATAQRQQLPPPAQDGISVAADCSAVAVGHGFWTRVTEFGVAAHAQGLSQPAMEVRARLELIPELERCGTAPAAIAARTEVFRRIRATRYPILYLDPRALQPQGPQHGGIYIPNGRRRRW